MRQSYLDHLEAVASEDVAGLKKAEQSYGDSWKKRGGVGAFMMLARKWDRIEQRVRQSFHSEGADILAGSWDVFAHIREDARAEGLIDDIRDLRRYLMLVEAEMRAQEATSATSAHRDNSGAPGQVTG